MRRLLIKIFDSKTHKQLESIVCHHLDATERVTVLSRVSFKHNEVLKTDITDIYTIPVRIDHWNIVDGLITIYYSTGFEMEISRIND